MPSMPSDASLIGQVGGLSAQVGIVHSAGGESAVADKGVSAGVVGDARLRQFGGDGQLGLHDLVIGGGEDCVHAVGDQRRRPRR